MRRVPRVRYIRYIRFIRGIRPMTTIRSGAGRLAHARTPQRRRPACAGLCGDLRVRVRSGWTRG